MLSWVAERLIEAAELGDLTEEQLDDVFDEFGVSTREQLLALARSRGWIGEEDRPLTREQRDYLRCFEMWLGSGTARDFLVRKYALDVMRRAA